MNSSVSLKQRKSQIIKEPLAALGTGNAAKPHEPHPAGEIKHGGFVQLLRMLLLAAWFMLCCTSIGITQWVGAPLYVFNQDYYYAYMSLTKQSFGVLTTTITEWFSPTLVRVSWDQSMRGQIRKTNGKLETMFPERLVLIANHQVYTDWLYMWWIAYTSRMHGHIFIILKESLRYIPILGTGMMFFGFVFMSRKWVSDKPRLKHRLDKLKSEHGGPMSGSANLDPMWLLIFPEGTNLSLNTRTKNRAWADREGIQDMEHLLLPRHTGLLFCLQQLHGTVDWVYDCTVAYEGTPRNGYAQDYFTLRSIYFQGRPPASVNMYWRRFAVSTIPLSDTKAFEAWLTERWREKDQLLEQHYSTGLFPADEVDPKGVGQNPDGYIDTEVKLKSWGDIAQIFVIMATGALLANVVVKMISMFS